MGQEEVIQKKIKNLEDMIDLLDAKIVFLFKKVNNITQTLNNIASKGGIAPPVMKKEESVPTYPAPTSQQVSVKADSLATAVREKKLYQESTQKPVMREPIPEPIPEIPIQQKARPTPTTPSAAAVKVPQPVQTMAPKVKQPKERVSLIEFFKNEENLPFFMMIAFYALLAAFVFGIIWTIQEIIRENAFLIIGTSSCVFTVLGFVWKLILDRKMKMKPEKEKKVKNFYIFPISFQALGTAGIFIAYILSESAVFPIAIGVAIVAFVLSIFYKNELLILESSLSIALLFLLPLTAVDPLIVSPYSGYIYFGFFMTFLLVAVLLAAFKVTVAPTLVALVTFPIFVFGPRVSAALELETLLVVIPSCVVAILMRFGAFDRHKFFNNKAMRAVILIVDLVLPLTSYYYLIFARNVESWMILLSSTLLVVSYFLSMKHVLSDRMKEFEIYNPNVVEFLSVLLVNTPMFLSLLAEMDIMATTIPESGKYIYFGIYLVFQIVYSILTMTWRIEKESTGYAHTIMTLFFVELMFLLFYTDVGNVQLNPQGFEIVMAVGLAFLFLAPLVNIIALRKSKHVLSSSFSIVLMGCLNFFIYNFLRRGMVEITPAPTISKFVVIGISIGIGVLALLDTLGKLSLGDGTSKITSAHMHALTILSLTIGFWTLSTIDVLNYITVVGIFLSVAVLVVNALFRKKLEKHITEDLLAYLSGSLLLLVISGTMTGPLAMVSAFLTISALVGITISAKTYNLLFPLLLYIPMSISIYIADAGALFGADWMISLVFLLPTIVLVVKSISNEQWYNRIGTVVLVAIMLMLTSYQLANYVIGGEIFIIINCFILIFVPIVLYTVNLWFFKTRSVLHTTIEYPIDLTIMTISSMVATFFISGTTIPIIDYLTFTFLVIGTVFGPLLYGINRIFYKKGEIPEDTYRFVSSGFVLAIQIMMIIAGWTLSDFTGLSSLYYIILLLGTALVGILIQAKEKFDSLTVLPSLATITILNIFNASFSPAISPWFTFGILVANLVMLSIGWFGSKYEQVTFAAYAVACVVFVVSIFAPDFSFFTGLPAYFPILLFVVWMIGVILSMVFTKNIPKGNMGDIQIWLFAITLVFMVWNRIIFLGSSTEFLTDMIGFNLTVIPSILVLIIFSSYLQYKTKDSPKGLLSHIIAVQLVLMVVGWLTFNWLPFYLTETAEILTYVVFNIFGVITFIVLESLVIERVLIRGQIKNTEAVNAIVFLPLFLFSLILSLVGGYLGVVPIILGIVFYGMSQRYEMKISSVMAAIAVAVGSFFIAPTDKILSWMGFGIVSALMTVMVVAGIVLYLRTHKKFHLLTNVMVALLSEALIGLLLPSYGEAAFTWPLKLGFSFNIALIGLLVGVIFEIREFRRIFAISSGIIIIPYLAFTFIQINEASYWALLFLGTGILFILASYLIYNRKKEQREKSEVPTP